jgi:hypothetical protein
MTRSLRQRLDGFSEPLLSSAGEDHLQFATAAGG